MNWYHPSIKILKTFTFPGGIVIAAANLEAALLKLREKYGFINLKPL